MLCRPREAKTSSMSMVNGRSISDGVNCCRTASRHPSEPERSKSSNYWGQSANELVTKNDIMSGVWPGASIGENTLHVHATAIRKALGPNRDLLKTVSGRGYRLLGNWTPRQHGSVSTLSSSPLIAPSINNSFPLAGRLIGRAAAARHVRDLASAYRVVTLTDPGGIGKTSLAIEAARGLLADFDSGAWFVELASLSNPDLLPHTVASTLGLKLSGEIFAESVARELGAKHLLLVLDNCEHIIDAAANLAERLTRLCPRTTILVTSREVLRIDGEAVYRVPALDVPAPGHEIPDHILGHSAVELFITRMNALDAGSSPHSEELTSVAAIRRRLDGIPLAIEFAAASAATLGIASVATGLRDRFALLTRGRRTSLPRHRTLRATLDWSCQLLGEAGRRLLRHLGVFPAGSTLEAAVAVMQDFETDSLDEAIQGGSNHTLCVVLSGCVGSIAVMTGNQDVADRTVSFLEDVTTKRGFRQHIRMAHLLQAMLSIARGEFQAGVALLSPELEANQAEDRKSIYPYFFNRFAPLFIDRCAPKRYGGGVAQGERGIANIEMTHRMREDGYTPEAPRSVLVARLGSRSHP